MPHEDAEQVRAVLDNAGVWQNLGASMPLPYTIENARAWIARCLDPAPNALQLAIDIDGNYAGGVFFRPEERWSLHTFEIGYWLAEKYWGRGIATEIVGIMTRHAFEKCGAERMQAHVYEWNGASRRVLEKNGFLLEARLRRAVNKRGRWGDVLAYGRLR
jgi:RimJ/RimL family protein N-acetyltransferase